MSMSLKMSPFAFSRVIMRGFLPVSVSAARASFSARRGTTLLMTTPSASKPTIPSSSAMRAARSSPLSSVFVGI